MQTATELHNLLLRFRNDTGAQLCSVVSSDFGTRVDVGRPSTLSADELEWGPPSSTAPGPRGDNFRRLATEIVGYSIAAEFETVDAADKARLKFDELVRKVENLVVEPP